MRTDKELNALSRQLATVSEAQLALSDVAGRAANDLERCHKMLDDLGVAPFETLSVRVQALTAWAKGNGCKGIDLCGFDLPSANADLKPFRGAS